MYYNHQLYQIYPLGFCGCPKENDGITTNRIKHVLDWIPHLNKTGFDTILFNPVFESERHGYDTIDFYKIDCRLGTNDDFKEVCDTLHQNNINIILDGVFNHVGRSFPYFLDVLQNKQNSQYCDFFYLDFNNNQNEDGFSYWDWEGHHELVKLNLDNPRVRTYLLDAVKYWIETFDIDGLRLDVAYCLNRDFMKELVSFAKALKPDFFFVGEMIGGDYNTLLRDGSLDSVTNYECRKGLYSSINSNNLFEIAHSLNRQFGKENWCLYTNENLLSFVDNHDVDRVSSIVNNHANLPVLYGIMYAMPGIPCIYYGSEWAITGTKHDGSDDDLRPYIKEPITNDLTSTITTLNHLHHTYDVFTKGDFENVVIQNTALIFKRQFEQHTLLACFNISDQEVTLYHDQLHDTFKELLQDQEIQCDGSIQIPANAMLYLYR